MLRLPGRTLVVLTLGLTLALQGGLSAQCTIDIDRELLIKDLSVIEDPVRTTCCAEQVVICDNLQEPLFLARAGAWTFGRLMEYMSGRTHPSKFIENWLNELKTAYSINGFNYPTQANKVAQIQLLEDRWRDASGGPTAPLDPCKSPFRLLAIVNRMDLNATTGSGGYGDPVVPVTAGEGRFVFGLFAQTDPANPHLGNNLEMSVIFEFNLKASNCRQVKTWAQRWHELSTIPLGDPCFNELLQDITDDFSGPNTDPGRPNGSSLNQLRTNEFIVSPWEMREFNIVLQDAGDNYSGQLKHVTTKQTPDNSLNNTALLDAWLRDAANYDAYCKVPAVSIPIIPDFFQGMGFMGGKATVPVNNPWTTFNFVASGNSVPVVPNPGPPGNCDTTVFHNFALQTCMGCHRDETGIFFYMIRPRNLGVEPLIADFLTGSGNVPDPRDPTVTRVFNDLQNRASILCNLLNMDCGLSCTGDPIAQVQGVQQQPLSGASNPTSVLAQPAASLGSSVTFASSALIATTATPCDVLLAVSTLAAGRVH